MKVMTWKHVSWKVLIKLSPNVEGQWHDFLLTQNTIFLFNRLSQISLNLCLNLCICIVWTAGFNGGLGTVRGQNVYRKIVSNRCTIRNCVTLKYHIIFQCVESRIFLLLCLEMMMDAQQTYTAVQELLLRAWKDRLPDIQWSIQMKRVLKGATIDGYTLCGKDTCSVQRN